MAQRKYGINNRILIRSSRLVLLGLAMAWTAVFLSRWQYRFLLRMIALGTKLCMFARCEVRSTWYIFYFIAFLRTFCGDELCATDEQARDLSDVCSLEHRL